MTHRMIIKKYRKKIAKAIQTQKKFNRELEIKRRKAEIRALSVKDDIRKEFRKIKL